MAPVRAGILTGGGDCPGLNAVIRAVTRRLQTSGWDVVGVREGWRGLVEDKLEQLGPREISGILPRGGTIIGTSRTNPFKLDGGVDAVLRNFAESSLDALVAIGGEDTLGVAARLSEEHDFPVVGVPKTIDNDLSGTDYTFGFDTAVWVCTEAIDRLHTTAESHNRVMVVEVMGRHTGLDRGHERDRRRRGRDPHPRASDHGRGRVSEITRRHSRGKDFSIVVVSEGYELKYASGEQRQVTQEAASTRSATCGSAASATSSPARSRSGPDTRRASRCSGTYSAAAPPRLATACSRHATASRRPTSCSSGSWGRMAALRGDTIVDVSLKEATEELKTVPPEWYDVAQAFFG